MTVEEAAAHIGARVRYRPHPGAEPELGVIGSTGSRYVFVQFEGDNQRKACYPEDLELIS